MSDDLPPAESEQSRLSVRQKMMEALARERLILEQWRQQAPSVFDFDAATRDLWELWRAEVGELRAPPPRPTPGNHQEAAEAIDLFQRAVDELAEPPPAAALGAQTVVEDDSAYRPAKEFLDTQFTTYKRLRAALKANPWIRTQKPSTQRLVIHAGDWQRFRKGLDAAGFGALDLSAETVEAFMAEVRNRQQEIKQRKAGK